MRIISGIYKGRKLQAGTDLSIRPTTDRVKEFIFNILHDFPQNINVADIFSGSGSLGLEALSRGAQKITFVEKNRLSIDILKKNISHLGIESIYYEILNLAADTYTREDHSDIGLYLMDPPFKYANLQNLVNNLTGSAYFSTGNLFVLEHEISNPIEPDGQSYTILKQKKMGRSLISFIEKRPI